MKKLLSFFLVLSFTLLLSSSTTIEYAKDKDKAIPPPGATVTLDGFENSSCVIEKVTLTYLDPISGTYTTEERDYSGSDQVSFRLTQTCGVDYCGNLTADVIAYDCEENSTISGKAVTSVHVRRGEAYGLKVTLNQGSDL